MPRGRSRILMPFGSVFGSWTVLWHACPFIRYGDSPYYTCACRCGRIVDVNGNQLRLGRSAGCRVCRYAEPINQLRRYEALYNRTKLAAIEGRNSRTKRQDFTLSYEEFLSIIATGRCHYCRVPLYWQSFGHGRKRIGNESTSHQMDRKDNSLGYLSGNVVACCWRCNHGKGDTFSYEEWFGMTGYLRHRSIVSKRKPLRVQFDQLQLTERLRSVTSDTKP